MAIRFSCTSCSKTLSVKEDFAGKKVKCPGCKTVLTVPATSTVSAKKMTVPPTKAPQKCDVKCEDCGSTFAGIEWKPDMTCLGCNSTKFFPVVDSDDEGESVSPSTSASTAVTSVKTTRRKPRKIKGPKLGGGGGWKKSPLVGGVLLILILGMWVNMGIKMVKGPGERPEIDMMCNACGKEFRAPIPTGPQPWECPACKEKELYTALQCENGHHFPVINPKPPKIDVPCPICGKTMVNEMGSYGGGMLVCPDQFRKDGTVGCQGRMMIATYYCYDDNYTWNVLPDKKGRLITPTKCPQCGSKHIINLYEYQPFCPICKSTKLKPITPYKRDKKK